MDDEPTTTYIEMLEQAFDAQETTLQKLQARLDHALAEVERLKAELREKAQ